MPTKSPVEFQDQLKTKLSEKWVSFAGLDAPTETFEAPPYAEADLALLLESERELAHESLTMQEFLMHPGWALMEKYRQFRIKCLQNKLESLNLETDQAKDIKAELRILRSYENYVLSKVGAF